MQAFSRLVGLALAARLRSAGALPWLLLMGWLLLASLQEPLVLRRYGIRLLDDAAWIGGSFVLVVVLFASQVQPRRFARSTNVLTLLLVASAHQAAVLMVDRGPLLAGLADRGMQSLLFLLAWLPLSLTLSWAGARRLSALAAGSLVPLAAFLLGVMLSVALRLHPDASTIAAAALASAASCSGVNNCKQ